MSFLIVLIVSKVFRSILSVCPSIIKSGLNDLTLSIILLLKLFFPDISKIPLLSLIKSLSLILINFNG